MPDSGEIAQPRSGIQAKATETKLLLGTYELGRLLGYGSSAKVYLARNVRTGQSVAIKTFSKLRFAKAGLSDHIKREISILRRLRHPHIVRLHEVLASRSKIYFVLDFAKGGELFDRVSSAGRLSEDLSRRFFQQLVAAVGYCHSRGVFHRDLKLENLLIDENGDLKVSDFGLSALPDQIGADGLFHTLCGTPAFVAPEILAKKGYCAASVDIWSCGIVLYVLVSGYLPFNDPNLMSLYRKIYRGEYRSPKWTSPEVRHLISRLLDTNPESRITIDEILHHPWFCKGLDANKRAAMARFHDESERGDEYCNISKAEAVEAEERELNAFDIIGFSTGVNLSGFFEAPAVIDRFISTKSPETIFQLVEEAGRNGGLVVRKNGKEGRTGLMLWGQDGNLIVRMDVHRLNSNLAVVEWQRGTPAASGEPWTGELWRDILIGNR
ncbi:hypothetical protein HPP92_011666 [Vanilla planifolia]|uniref:non-specific serine/threonine protein kinase n=1 Tax=Vanilla planifolia TaxID=51239 RepID=A0A835RCT6_VANPL|nr:hypothetical protein HPP92_011666 [Vanilla planifolia]